MPYPPMPETLVLYPFEENESNVEEYKEIFKKVQELLKSVSEEESAMFNNFEYFLSHLEISYEEYKFASRYSLKKPQVFFRRQFSDRLLNAYNRNILGLHRANMDIQFILDAYACCSYIINYINKSNHGVSQLLREEMAEISHGSVSVKRKLEHLGSKFINATEISAQEAAYNILGLHLSEASQGNGFINTCHPDKRVRIVRSIRELEQLPANSTDIFERNLLDQYVQRHEQLESLCIAEFAAWFKFSKLNARSEQSKEEYDEAIDFDADEENNVAAQRYQMLNGTCSRQKGV